MKSGSFLITVLKKYGCKKYAIRVDLARIGLGENCLSGPGKKLNREKIFSLLPETFRKDSALVTVEKIDECIIH